MTIGLLKNIIDHAPRGSALLGLDVGKKTIGLALSDPSQSIATPLQTIKRTKFTADMKALETIITDYEVGGFVIGYPVNMDGSEGPRAQSIRDFAVEMENYL
ncbi:MAG: Holliday junction resolvase RuvX, partial [Bdellovibrionales bacterium]